MAPSPCTAGGYSARPCQQLEAAAAAAVSAAGEEEVEEEEARQARVDAMYMREAVALAQRAVGKTSPNPIVGCVVVRDGKVVGRGFHPKAGEPHAEVFALREAGKRAAGATAYVTLEPCNHFGRTPPCSQALVRANVARVVVGTTDPNPLVAGKGIQTLRNAGIDVTVGVEEDACRRNVEAFFHRIVNKRPFATMRYSMTLDGRLLPGPSASSDTAGSYYSRLLQESDAVVVSSAALLHNPALTLLSREPDCRQPLRVVAALDLADLDPAAPVFDTAHAPTLVVASQRALAADVARAGGGADGNVAPRQTAEQWMAAKGVQLVVPGPEVTPSAILQLCYERDAIAVLWDCQGPAGSSLEGYLGQWAAGDDAVDKVVVAVAPTLSGKGGGSRGGAAVSGPEGLFLELDCESVDLRRLVTYKSGDEVVIEAYLE